MVSVFVGVFGVLWRVILCLGMVRYHLGCKVSYMDSYEGLGDVCYMCYGLLYVVFRECEYLDGNIFKVGVGKLSPVIGVYCHKLG